MAEILTQPEPDMSWIDLVSGRQWLPEPMGEAEVLESWKREVDQDLKLQNVYRQVVEDLLNCSGYQEALHFERADPDLKDKALYFGEIVRLSIRYAHACSKQHEHSAGVRRKVRNELRDAVRQWSKWDKHNG